MINDRLGDVCKKFETVETEQYFDKNKFLIARLDGRSFSSYTKNMNKSFDLKLISLMMELSESLMKEFNCDVIYHQSDEITMIWFSSQKLIFEGKKHKLLSVIPAYASSLFSTLIPDFFGIPHNLGDQVPCFDCRIFQVDTVDDIVDQLYWRVKDCKKNSISQIANHLYNHKNLHKKTTKMKIEMIKEKTGIDVRDLYHSLELYGNVLFKQRVHRQKVQSGNVIKYIRKVVCNFQFETEPFREDVVNLIYNISAGVVDWP